MIKKARFWLMFISLLIIFINILGLDDMNLLLFLSCPLMWITETGWFAVNFMHPAKINIAVYYISTVAFWSLLGYFVDYLIGKGKTQK